MTEDASRENTYPIGKYPAVNQDVFLTARANAIQAFASLEFSLSIVFSRWLGTAPELGGLVFFRIINTHSRNRILDDLKETHFPDQYSLFWNSLLKLIRQIDQRRNEIVHWHVVNTIDLDLPHKEASRLTLSPPTGWTSKSTASINEDDLEKFIRKCNFVARLATMFSFLKTEHAEALGETWLDIFQRPIVYPPPDTHPLSPNYKTPESTPQFSGAS